MVGFAPFLANGYVTIFGYFFSFAKTVEPLPLQNATIYSLFESFHRNYKN